MTSKNRLGWQRLSDVQVPKGILWVILLASYVRQRATDRAVERFSKSANELGTLLGTRMRESDEREGELLKLQASVERLTRWLVRLTVALAILGVASIVVAVATLR
jgi:hypothetical protein